MIRSFSSVTQLADNFKEAALRLTSYYVGINYTKYEIIDLQKVKIKLNVYKQVNMY
jgi:hypothetical protein